MSHRSSPRSLFVTLPCLAGILCLVAAAPASAVSLSSRPTGPGPHYFGYFASANQYVGVAGGGCPAGDFTQCVSDHANLTFIWGDTTFELNALSEARNLGMGAILEVENLFFAANANGLVHPLQLQANYSQNWDSFQALIQPYLDSQTIVSFYLTDEPPIDSASISTINTVAHFLACHLPSVHRQITFTANSVDGGGFQIPNDLDWVGYDCYTPPPGTFLNCSPGNGSVPYYVSRLKTLIRGSAPPGGTYNPQLVLVPAAYLVQDTSSAKQTQLLQRVEREIAMAENDPSFALIMPFLWQFDNSSNFGVNMLPTVKTYYQGLGKHVTTGALRPVYPTGATASSSVGNAIPYNAFDYDTGWVWNSGKLPTGHIDATFADPIPLSQIVLYVDQSPSGNAHHDLYGYRPTDGSKFLLTSNAGNFVDYQVLSDKFSTPSVTTGLQVFTASSPSWVAWRDIRLWTNGSTRLYAYPIAATGSNYTYPDYIADGNTATAWNSGGYAPQSITLDLGQAQSISLIQLVVLQSPAGVTNHSIYGGPSLTQMAVLAISNANTSDGQTLQFPGPFANIRYLKIMTNASPSWVGWREINVFKSSP